MTASSRLASRHALVLLTSLLVLLALSLLLVPVALAAQASNFQFMANGQRVQYASPAHEQLADLAFTTDSDQGYVYLDLSGVHNDPATAASQREVRVSLTQCDWNATTARASCTVPNVRVRPSNTTVTIGYRLFKGGSSTPGTATYSFTLDETSPKVVKITTGSCDSRRCYVGSGVSTPITITLEDSTATFAKKLVFYQLGSRTFNVDSCTGMTCTGKASVSCADEAPLDLKVVSVNGVNSQDDAGNPVSNAGEVTRVLCDATPPKIVNVAVKGDNTLGLVTNDGNLLVTANIRDAVTLVTLTAMTKNVQNNVSATANESNACVKKENDEQECTLSIGNLKYGRNLDLPLVFTDAVGHETTTTVKIKAILKVANATTTPNFFHAKATAVTPQLVNRVALQLALDNAIDYPYFVNYEITRQTSGAKILHQEMKATSCAVVMNPKSVARPFEPHDAENWTATPALYLDPIRVFYPTADWNVPGGNRLDASFLKMDANQLANDVLLVRCNLSLTVEKDNTLYTLPEQETLYWPVSLKNSKLGTPGEAFLRKIDTTRDDLEGGTSQLIGYANQLFGTMAHLCQMQDLLLILQQQGLSAEGMGLLMMHTGIGAQIARGGNALTRSMMMASMPYWMSLFGGKTPQGVQPGTTAIDSGLGRQMCDFVHCSTAEKMKNMSQTKPDSWFLSDEGFANDMSAQGGQGKTADWWQDRMGDLNQPDVSNSIIASMMTNCWSGVVHNLNKYREIDCGYLQCLKEQALNGASITPCELGRGVKMCRFVMGEVMELPYVRVLKNFAANVNKIVQAPLSILWDSWAKGTCQPYLQGAESSQITWQGFFCQLGMTIMQQEEFTSVTSYNGLFSFPYKADLCQKALCEGDECDRTTNSLLEGLTNQGYMGDQYRDAWNRRQKNQENAELYAAVGEWTKAGKEEYSDKKYDSLRAYAKENNLEKGGEKYFNDMKTYCSEKKINCQSNFEGMIADGKNPADLDKFKEYSSTPQSAVSKKNQDAAYQLSLGKNCALIKDGVCYPSSCVVDGEITTIGGQCAKDFDSENEFYNSNCFLETGGKRYVCKKDAGGACPSVAASCTETSTLSKPGSLSDYQKTAQFYEWVGMMGSIMYQYYREQGKLNFLFLSGWGDWGSGISAKSNEMLNPDEWVNNLCNPTGNAADLTLDDGSVYAWTGENYRAVLTFAGEKLSLENRARDPEAPLQTLYTVSGIVVLPRLEPTQQGRDNSFTVLLEPGAFVVLKDQRLARGEPVNFAKAVNSSIDYAKVCIAFKEDFPQPGADKRYCQDFQPNAYDRGGVTNESMPDWGVDDPYGSPWESGNSMATGTTTGYGAGTTGYGGGYS